LCFFNTNKMEEIESENQQQNNELKLYESEEVPLLGTGIGDKSFYLQAKNIGLTYARCDMLPDQMLKAMKSLLKTKAKTELEYIIVSREYHEDGFPHLHALITTVVKIRTRDCKFFDVLGFHPNILNPIRNEDAWLRYVKKRNDYVEEGSYIGTNQSKLQKRAMHNKLVFEKPLTQLLEEGIIHASQTKQYRDAKLIYQLEKCQEVVPIDTPRTCIWLYGLSREGKSYYAYHSFSDRPEDIYQKELSHTFWSGYINQKIVVLDDLGPTNAHLATDLKHWADNYRFLANVKGTFIIPSYTHLIVTSQHLPETIWPHTLSTPQTELHSAIRNRFKFYEVINRRLYPMDHPAEFLEREKQLQWEAKQRLYKYQHDGYEGSSHLDS